MHLALPAGLSDGFFVVVVVVVVFFDVYANIFESSSREAYSHAMELLEPSPFHLKADDGNSLRPCLSFACGCRKLVVPREAENQVLKRI